MQHNSINSSQRIKHGSMALNRERHELTYTVYTVYSRAHRKVWPFQSDKNLKGWRIHRPHDFLYLFYGMSILNSASIFQVYVTSVLSLCSQYFSVFMFSLCSPSVQSSNELLAVPRCKALLPASAHRWPSTEQSWWRPGPHGNPGENCENRLEDRKKRNDI